MSKFHAVTLFTAILAIAVPPAHAWAADEPRVTAQEGVAIGGAVSNSTITNTVNQENPATLGMLAKALSDKDASETKRREAEAKAAELATKWGFTTAAVAEVFRIVGEQNIPEEKAPAKLIEIATHFAQTRQALAALEPDDPQAAELARQAKSAFDAGRLAEADTLLERAKELEAAALGEARRLMQIAQQAIDRHGLNLAQMEATQGDIAQTQAHYDEAARHYAAAASQVPSTRPDEQRRYRELEARALYQQGDERGDNDALRNAIGIYHRMLQERTRDRVPLEWAATQNNLGAALRTLGERESGTARLDEAVAAYRAALQENTRERVPLEWAWTQYNLGRALWLLGKREHGTAHLEEAVAVLNACLADCPQDLAQFVRTHYDEAQAEIARRSAK